MPDAEFVSYSLYGEDVVLWRALGRLPHGRFVDVGARDLDSSTRALTERGWRGLNITSQVAVFETLTVQRADDVTVLAQPDGPDAADVIARHADELGQVHVLRVGLGGDGEVRLGSIDLDGLRPWVIVVEAAPDASTADSIEAAVVGANYRACLFDGRARFYVAAEHVDALSESLSYPAGPRDRYLTSAAVHARSTIDKLHADVLRWRGTALRSWTKAAVLDADHFLMSRHDLEAKQAEIEQARAQTEQLRVELDAARNEVTHIRHELQRHQETLSWRVTKPLRGIRRPGHPVADQ